ncbi:MAG: hypothetical protein JWL83_608 [Actinomycetia bacterium]|nr:hypothetical protein [Actinomycetes bacterium]
MHPTHRRDAGLRKVSTFTRRFTVGAVALTGVFTALVARAQPAKHARKATLAAKSAPAPTVGTQAATPGTLPPDTFPPTNTPNASSAPASPGTTPATQAPQPPAQVPDTTPLPPQASSGSS